ncbi:hypothetical protein [Aliiroseovarius marinus]|uniref:hypothetical protein n=1 Tax=Aliiroseovarius marinus TaxID=2500159 RepID=UPI00249416E5|nr:hypothetical protein [Aliiroseovarius marinus]
MNIYQIHTVRECDGQAFIPDYPLDYIAVPPSRDAVHAAQELLDGMYPGYALRLTKTDLAFAEFEARGEQCYNDRLRELLA